MKNKNNPKITVLMSVYNAEEFLEDSIKSILSQSYKDFEFIIIDDASTDNSLKILEKYCRTDKRIKLIKNKNNLGLTKSLNKGLKKARGCFIARQDADDVSFSTRLEEQFNYLEKNSNIFLVSCLCEYINEDGDYLGVPSPIRSSRKIKWKLEKYNCLVHSSIFFRNEEINYREKFKYSQDYDFYLRLLSGSKNINTLNKVLIKYRINSRGISFRKIKYQEYFKNKALFFYKQRKKNKKDDYESFNFNFNKIILKDINDKELLLNNISLYIHLNNHLKANKLIKKYIKKYNYDYNVFIKIILYFYNFLFSLIRSK